MSLEMINNPRSLAALLSPGRVLLPVHRVVSQESERGPNACLPSCVTDPRALSSPKPPLASQLATRSSPWHGQRNPIKHTKQKRNPLTQVSQFYSEGSPRPRPRPRLIVNHAVSTRLPFRAANSSGTQKRVRAGLPTHWHSREQERLAKDSTSSKSDADRAGCKRY